MDRRIEESVISIGRHREEDISDGKTQVLPRVQAVADMGAQHGGQDRCMAQAAQPAIKYDAVVGFRSEFLHASG
jgi:hypothetical protein